MRETSGRTILTPAPPVPPAIGAFSTTANGTELRTGPGVKDEHLTCWIYHVMCFGEAGMNEKASDGLTLPVSRPPGVALLPPKTFSTFMSDFCTII
jgi:hypothetical protein